MEELIAPPGHQRTLLGVQEMNRSKGRISPLPQAVQGAQSQLAGPAGEPGIKSEFGRMFSGIGTGVGTISSPVPTGAQLPFAAPGMMRRDDMDGNVIDLSVDPGNSKPGPQAARGKRRKLKEEDARNDDESTGRQTPVNGRAKKAKTHAHHHHQYVAPPFPCCCPLPELTRCLATITTTTTTILSRDHRLPETHPSRASRGPPPSRHPTGPLARSCRMSITMEFRALLRKAQAMLPTHESPRCRQAPLPS